MIQVFFCSAPQTAMRQEIAAQCFCYWMKSIADKELLYHLTPDFLKCSDYDFQRERRIYAENEAKGPIYMLVDDDIGPVLGDGETLETWIDRGVELLEQHPEFASLHPWIDGIGKWTPENYEVFEDDDVVQHHSAGGIRFIRKGTMKDWPEQTGVGYDNTQGAYLLQKGYRVGYFKHLKAVHHGAGERSDLWRHIYQPQAVTQ